MAVKLLMKQNGPKMRLTGPITWAFVGLLSMVSSGCVDLTGRPADPVQSAVVTSDRADFQYEGHAFGMRGFLGVFSLGIDGLANRLNHGHIIQAAAIADHSKGQFQPHYPAGLPQTPDARPADPVWPFLGGGRSDTRCLPLGRHGIKVQLLLLIDPVTPPRVPANVERCIDIYKSHPDSDWLPIWRGVPAKAKDIYRTRLTDINLRYAAVDFPTKKLTHATIIDSPGVQKMMLHAILDACRRWQSRHPKVNMANRRQTQDKMTKVSDNPSP